MHHLVGHTSQVQNGLQLVSKNMVGGPEKRVSTSLLTPRRYSYSEHGQMYCRSIKITDVFFQVCSYSSFWLDSVQHACVCHMELHHEQALGYIILDLTACVRTMMWHASWMKACTRTCLVLLIYMSSWHNLPVKQKSPPSSTCQDTGNRMPAARSAGVWQRTLWCMAAASICLKQLNIRQSCLQESRADLQICDWLYIATTGTAQYGWHAAEGQ